MNEETNAPMCLAGLTSLGMPLAGVAVAWIFLSIPWEKAQEWGFDHWRVGVIIFAALSALGCVLAIVSVARGERWKLVPLAGLIGNALAVGLVLKLMMAT